FGRLWPGHDVARSVQTNWKPRANSTSRARACRSPGSPPAPCARRRPACAGARWHAAPWCRSRSPWLRYRRRGCRPRWSSFLPPAARPARRRPSGDPWRSGARAGHHAFPQSTWKPPKATRHERLEGRFSKAKALRSRRGGGHPRSTQAPPKSVFVACLVELRLLVLAGRRLILRLPFLVRHAVDRLAARLLGHRHALGVGGVLHPVGQAVAAEAGEIHQVDVLHFRMGAQVLEQAAERRGLELGAGLVVKRHGGSSRRNR